MDKKYKCKKTLKFLWLQDIPLGVCFFLMVIGLLMGSVFVIGTWHWGKLIEREDAIAVSATFSEYLMHTSPKGSAESVEICFTNRDSLFIDSAVFDETVKKGLDTLRRGDSVELFIHPNSGDIWELRSEDAVILDFEYAKSRMLVDNFLFSGLGLFGYMCAAMGAVSMVIQLVQRKKEREIVHQKGR